MGDDAPESRSAEQEGPSLSRLASRGALWQSVSFFGGKVLLLAATVVLARVLTPEEFGLVSLALVVIGFLDVISDLGVSQALIYLDRSQRRTDTALVATVVLGAVIALGLTLLAPVVGQQLHQPETVPLLRLLALSIFAGSVGVVPDTLLRKALDFRRRVPVQLSLSATRGVLAIVLALAGFGVWALAIAQVAAQIVSSGVAWALVTYRPHREVWRVRRAELVELFRYGVPTAASGLLSNLVLNIDYIIVGRVLGATQLGLYTLAFRVPEMLVVSVFQIVSSVTFPAYSQANKSLERVRRAYLRVLRLQNTYGLLMSALLFVLAPLVITVIFGPEWRPSIYSMQALAIYAAFRSLGMGVVDLLKGIGRPNVALIIAVVRFVVVAVALVLVAAQGITAVSVTQAVAAFALMVMVQAVAGRSLHLSWVRLVGSYVPGLAAAAAAALASQAVVTLTSMNNVATLVSAGLLGAVAGGAVASLSAAWRRDVRSVLPRSGRSVAAS